MADLIKNTPPLWKYLLLAFALLFMLVGERIIDALSERDLDRYLLVPPERIETVSSGTSITATSAALLLKGFAAHPFHQFHDEPGSRETELFGIQIAFTIEPKDFAEQQYELTLTDNRIELKAGGEAGIFYGQLTLDQLLGYAAEEDVSLSQIRISDWPDIERRGYMLDISRDKIPTMESLFALVDLLARLKINELQLYTEHTFAYSKHEKVWAGWDPMTDRQIRELDAYCQARYIELVPNQNSFGHMEHWLEHDEYAHLAECPTECETNWGPSKRTSLDPGAPQVLDFIAGLYGELLPNFRSKQINIGGDETMELCKGKSQQRCATMGNQAVYLDHIIKLDSIAGLYDRKTQVWADMLLEDPEMIEFLPADMTALVWNYEADHLFEKELYHFNRSGHETYVCPGTSTWRSEIGRNENAFRNLKRAAVAAKHYNSKGYLITNWGDYGHFQPLSVVYPALIVGASYAWNVDGTSLKDLEFKLDRFCYTDPTGHFAKAILKLGNAYLKANIPEGNSNAFHLMLRRYKWTMEGNYQTREMTIEGLEQAKKEIDDALLMLDQSDPQGRDAALLLEETVQAARLARHGADLGIARLRSPDGSVKNIPTEIRLQLAEDLKELIGEHKRIWVKRNRVGGLDRSAGKLEELLQYYRTNEKIE